MKRPGKGFVGRLAAVLFVALVALAPPVIILQERASVQNTRQKTYDLCMEVANSGSTIFTREYCWDQRFPANGNYAPFWPKYGEYALAIAIGLSILYALAWLLGRLGLWIWRGSKATPTQ